MRQNPLFKKLNGWQTAYRDRFLLLSGGILTPEEFVVYEICIGITDWHNAEGHEEIYGKFQATNKQIAEIGGWQSDSTVYRIKKRLIEKKILIPDGEYLRVKDFERWQFRSRTTAKLHEQPAKLQSEPANTQKEVAKTQDLRVQNPTYPLVSSKSNLSSFRTDSEYREFVDSGQFGSLTIDDMRWIDENVKESANVPA